MRIYLLVLFILAMGNSIAADQFNLQQHRIIEVSGVASVVSVPDRFSFSLSIVEKGKIAADLNQAIAEKTNAVLQALTKIGVDKKAVQTLQVQFNPWIEHNGKIRESKGFILKRQIKLTLKSLVLYERSLDAVIELGVSNINQFTFTNSQAAENYQVALKQALLNAKLRATDMAKVLDLKLGTVVSISEQSSGQVSPMVMQTRQFTSESYLPGEMSTQATVKVIFSLQDGL